MTSKTEKIRYTRRMKQSRKNNFFIFFYISSLIRTFQILYCVSPCGLDSDPSVFAKSVRRYFMPPRQICDGKGFEGDIAKAYNIRMIPASILIDKKGIIRESYVPAEELEKKIVELSAEK